MKLKEIRKWNCFKTKNLYGILFNFFNNEKKRESYILLIN